MASRKCMCCNVKYSYCPTCGGDKKKPTYLSTFCSESCKDLWTTLSKVSMDMIDKSKAVEIINSLNLKDTSKYVECVQRDMKKLFEKEIKVKKTSVPAVEKPTATKEVAEKIAVEATKTAKTHEVVETKE